MLTRRQTMKYSFVSAGAAMVGPAVLLPRLGGEQQPVYVAGTTLDQTIAPARGRGYRRLGYRDGDPLVVRQELAEARKDRAARRTALGVVAQVTDLHLVDVQNPLRFEYLDRRCGTGHRPQELLGTHGATALVRKINQLRLGPFTGRVVDAVMTTGDNTDNQSGTELEWLLTVLAGGTVHPDSGGASFEGVAGSELYEYWQPESPRSDRYKDAGFPHVPGLLAAATRPFHSPGLEVPWLLTMGNHDDTTLGTLANRGYTSEWCAGDRKIFSSAADETLVLSSLTSGRTPRPHDVGELLAAIARRGDTRTVVTDERRLPFTAAEYVAALRDPRFQGAGPVGHGYAPDADGSRLYYSYELSADVLAVSLDTTNQAGGADGSIGTEQLGWLSRELGAAADRYVVVFSHHPSYAMENLAPDPRNPLEERHNGDRLVRLLQQHRNVVAWVNGHSHRNNISARGTFWEINSASHIDAPQQARIIELARNGDGTLSILTTMVDADAPARTSYDDLSPRGLAGLYRELAYNDLDLKDRRGSVADRNAELLLPDPFTLAG